MQEGNPSTEQMFIVAPMFSIDGSMANLFSTHPPLEERIRAFAGHGRGPGVRRCF